MSKQAKARRYTDAEAVAKVRTIRISPRKLNLVAQSIHGLAMGGFTLNFGSSGLK